MRVRDSQRTKVVTAMWQEPSTPMTRKQLIAIADKLVRTKWFRRNFRQVRGHAAGIDGMVSRWAKSPRALAYSLAWCYRLRKPGLETTGALHGREFAAALLVLVRKLEGAEKAKAVRASFGRTRAKYTRPRKPRTLSGLDKAALRARLDGARAKKESVASTPVGETCVRCGKPYIPGDPFTSHTPDCRWYGSE